MTDVYIRRVHVVELARNLPDKKDHLRSIAVGLAEIHASLRYCIRCLECFESQDLRLYDLDAMAEKMTTATVRLEGLLDAIVICEHPSDISLKSSINFFRTDLTARDIRRNQDSIRELRSFSTTNRDTYVDLWGVADFWKHYLPWTPRPVQFDGGYYDIQINLADGHSGPLLHDLIVPAFNGACRIVVNMSRRLGIEDLCALEEIKW